MPQNLIEIRVTGDTHALGPGIVLQVEAQWDREVPRVPASAPILSRDHAELLARDHFSLPHTEPATGDLLWTCFFTDRRPDCHLTWRVFLQNLRTDVSSVGASPDTAWVDAVRGEVIAASRGTRDYIGFLEQPTNYPFESALTFRDFAWARVRGTDSSGASIFVSSNDDGYYDNPSVSTAGAVGLHADIGDTEIRNVSAHDCNQSLDPTFRNFTFGGTDQIAIASSPPAMPLLDALWFHWLVRYSRIYATTFSNAIELPSFIDYNIGTGAVGQMIPCDGSSQRATIGVLSPTNDSVNEAWAVRDTGAEEWHHAVEWCTQTVGPGCGDTIALPRRGIAWAIGDGFGPAVGSHLNDYETWTRGWAALGEFRYNGINQPGDMMLYDEEIDGTATSGAAGCNFEIGGTYNCAADEACWAISHDRPRCMKRAADIATCRTMFPNQPGIDNKPYGFAPGVGTAAAPVIPICTSNDYNNPTQLAMTSLHLLNAAGFFRGVGAFHWAERAVTTSREYSSGADTFHREFAEWAGDYESSDAMHAWSNEVFPWWDDTTNVWTHAEVIRPIWAGTTTFTQGGPTGTSLAFSAGTGSSGSVSDNDDFLMLAVPGNTYEIAASTASVNVDLCVRAYSHTTSALLGSAGCTDGSSTAALRNATLQFAVPAGTDRVDFEIDNVLNLAGTYQLALRNVGDDYPDVFGNRHMSRPLRPGGVLATGTLSTTSDLDIFHTDTAHTFSGDLTFSATGTAGPASVLSVWRVTGDAAPTGSPVATGTGLATVIGALPNSRYYVRIGTTTVTGAYTIAVTHGSCGTACNPNGTMDDPLYFPSAVGGTVLNRLDFSSATAGHDLWTDCSSGEACDWYRIDLADGERMSATLHTVHSSTCSLEVSIFSPRVDGDFFTFAEGGTLARRPVVYDEGGAMESNGAQVAFEAPRAGQYRVRVRSRHPTAAGCQYYGLTVARGVMGSAPPPPD